MHKKLHFRYFSFFFSSLMAVFMSCIVSGAITAINLGVQSDFIARWMEAWSGAFLIAFVAMQIAAPLMRRLTATFVELPPPPRPRKAAGGAKGGQVPENSL